MKGGALTTDVQGYGLRAFVIKPGAPTVQVTPVESRPFELPFDADVVSTNNKRNDGSIGGDGRTYPAEQLPASIVTDGATFTLGSTANGRKNALLCSGQTLALPTSDADRLDLLVASVNGDQRVTFSVDQSHADAIVPAWTGYVGQWDNRVWVGEVQEMVFNWTAKFGGLDPGYLKPAEVAWFTSHHHTPSGDQFYNYCYLFKVSIDVPKGAKTVTLPSNDNVMILAATLVKGAAHATPAAPMFDRLDDREQDAPSITPAGGSFADATAMTIAPRLYGRFDAIRYTLDGSDPTATSPKFEKAVLLRQATTVKAALLSADGKTGPVTQARVMVDDRTPPGVVSAAVAYREPTIGVTFSEPLAKTSAGTADNYALEPAIAVKAAKVDDAARQVTLTLDAPLESGRTYSLRIRRVADDSPNHNTIGNARVTIAAPMPVFHLAEVKPEQRGKAIVAPGLPVKGGDAWTLNMFVKADKQPENRTVIAGFGACDGKVVGGGRYICKFANGVRFWAHNSDLASKSPLDLGQWQMITATSDGKTLRLYQNGELLGERDATLADDESVVIVAPLDPWENKRRFDGEVREVTIWNAALNQAAIKALQSGAQLP